VGRRSIGGRTVPCPNCGYAGSTTPAAACPQCGRPTQAAGHTPPIAQAVPPQPLPVEPKGDFARRLGYGLLLAVAAGLLLFLLATTLWRLD
jgi:hypothetical protein